MTTTTTTNLRLEKTTACYNPFFFEGRQICDIIIYDGKEEVYRSYKGWIGSGNNKNDFLELKTEKVWRATTKTLDKCREKNRFFYIKSKKKYRESEHEFYIPLSKIGFEDLGVSESFRDDHEIYMQRRYKIEINGELKEIDGSYEESVLIPKGIKRNSLLEHAKKKGVEVNKYQIEKLMEIFEMSIKGAV